MLGTDFPYNDWYPKRAKIAQVDIRPEPRRALPASTWDSLAT